MEQPPTMTSSLCNTELLTNIFVFIFVLPNTNIQEQRTTLQTIPLFPVKLAFCEAITPAWLDKALGGPLLCLSQRGKIDSAENQTDNRRAL